MKTILGPALLLVSLLSPAVALAQGADTKVAAQALFDDGRKLMEQGNYADACKKLEASQRLDPGAGTLLNLAACYEKNGQTASAWVTYKDASTASQNRHPDWVDRCDKKVAELEPTLSKLTVAVASPVPGLEVVRDGVAIASGSYGVPIPIDSGEHKIEAHAPGYKPFVTKVTIGASKDSQSVSIPALAEDEAAQAGGRKRGTTQIIVGGVLIGVGGVGLAVGAVFGLIAMGKKSDATNPAYCTSDLSRCNETGLGMVSDAKTDGTISTVAFIAGGAFVVGGIVVAVTAPKGSEKPTPAQASLSLRSGAAGAPLGLSLSGSF